MPEWIEINLPWRYFNEADNRQLSAITSQYNDWWVSKRSQMIGDPVRWNDQSLQNFNEWLRVQPETAALNKAIADHHEETNARQFASHPLNKAGVLIEVKNKNDIGQLLIGNALEDGGTGGEWGLNTEDIVLRALDLRDVIKEFTPP